MTLILDQATVHRECSDIIPAEITDPLAAHVCGPQAELRRYTDAGEKPMALLGPYIPAMNTVYNWPNRTVGSLIDLSFVHVFMDDAVLRYYQDVTGGGAGTIAAVASYKNRIAISASDGFKANGTAYPRLAGLKDRDVAVGDWIKVRGGTPAQELVTSVSDLIADTVAAVVAAAAGETANAATCPNNQLTVLPSVTPTGGGPTGGLLAAGTYFLQYTFVGTWGETWGSSSHQGAGTVTFTIAAGNIPAVTLPALPAGATSIKIYLTQAGGLAGTETLYASGITATTANLAAAHTTGTAAVPKSAVQTSGTVNNVTAKAVGTAYRDEAGGDIADTYTITCTAGSTGGDATSARLRVTTASGRDDVASVTPAAFAAATAVGTRGLTVTFATSGGNELLIGQTWQVVARQLWTAPTSTSGGTYTGVERNETFTYVVRVVGGGRYADATKPQITVSRDDGGDTSGPTAVGSHTTAVAVGTRGVTISFSNNGANPGLRKNDVYYIQVTSGKDGAYKTLVLKNNMNDLLVAAADLEITLGIKKSIEVAKNRLSSPPNVNWVAAADTVEIKSAIDAYDPTFTDAGVQVAMAVIEGTVYTHYRAWLTANAEAVGHYSPGSRDATVIKAEVEALLGKADPDNLLSYAVWKAATNSNEKTVLYTAVPDPDSVSSWTAVLDMITSYRFVYGLVPLTHNPEVLAAWKAHVEERSADEVGGEWRVAWLAPQATSARAVADAAAATDGQTIQATLADNPNVTDTQYTYLTVTTGNAAFMTNGVLKGDIVRYLYSQDSFGVEVYHEFVVESVVNEDTLVLANGHTSAVATSQRVEVWRNQKKSEIATVLADAARGFSSSRVRCVWPDMVEDGGLSVDGVFLAAALAGYVSGIAPHQGLRYLQITGFDGVSRSTNFFNNAQLNILAEAGYFVVGIDHEGFVYTRNAKTTDVSSVETGEEVVVRNGDALLHLFYGRIERFFGRANNVPDSHVMIRTELMAGQEQAKNATRIERLGSMISESSLVELRVHATLKDRVVAQMQVVKPYPINEATVTLVI